MKDLGPIHHFLGSFVSRTSSGLQLSLRQYYLDSPGLACMTVILFLLQLTRMPNFLSTNGSHVSDPSLYLSLVDALRYATLTRLDIVYYVQQV